MSLAAAGPRRRALTFLRPLIVALLVWASLAASPAAPSAAAATPDLTLETSATYVVDPAHARVAVGVDIVATDHKPDTSNFRYYFEDAYLAVLPQASGFTLTVPGATPSVSVSRRTADFILLRLTFGTRVYSGRPLRLHLAFQLADRGGSPTRDVRVGQALVQFPVWAFASTGTPGSSVAVVVPAGYTVQVTAGQLDGPVPGPGATQVLSSGALADPLSFFAYVTADRPGAYAASTITTSVGGRPASIEVDAWPDDAAWGKRVGDLFRRGLPGIWAAVGLPYSRTDPLVIRESVSRTLGGYAGIFDPSSGRIDVDFAAGPFVILHEASHVWFNGSLLAERWANEAFASYYASVAGKAIGASGGPDPLTPDLLASRIPLNAWGAIGQETPATESYAYAATAVLAQKIGERAGADGLRRVWAAAAADEAAYQPPGGGPIERVDKPPDWRGLLDLLEERTGKRYDDLWLEYVVRANEAPLLVTRAATRAEYVALLARAADWRLPASIRSALTAWQFDAAGGLMSQAGEVLDARATIASAASAAGLVPPSALRQAFEGDRGFPAAKAEADAELRAIAVVQKAAAARPGAGDPFVAIGLIGSDPEGDLTAARAAFASGDLAAATSGSLVVEAAWQGAHDTGVRRVLSGGGALLLVLLMLALIAFRVRSGRRARRARAFARAAVAAGPYATLAAEPPSVRGVDRPDGGGGEGSEST